MLTIRRLLWLAKTRSLIFYRLMAYKSKGRVVAAPTVPLLIRSRVKADSYDRQAPHAQLTTVESIPFDDSDSASLCPAD